MTKMHLSKKKVILLAISMCVVVFLVLLWSGKVDVESAIAEFEARPST